MMWWHCYRWACSYLSSHRASLLLAETNLYCFVTEAHAQDKLDKRHGEDLTYNLKIASLEPDSRWKWFGGLFILGVGMQQMQWGDYWQSVYSVWLARLQHCQHGLPVRQEPHLAVESSLSWTARRLPHHQLSYCVLWLLGHHQAVVSHLSAARFQHQRDRKKEIVEFSITFITVYVTDSLPSQSLDRYLTSKTEPKWNKIRPLHSTPGSTGCYAIQLRDRVGHHQQMLFTCSQDSVVVILFWIIWISHYFSACFKNGTI